MASDKKTKIMFAVLIIVIFVLSFVLGLIWFGNWNANKQTKAYQIGYQQGAAAAILEIIQRSQGCKTVPLFAGNVTYTFVDMGCITVAA